MIVTSAHYLIVTLMTSKIRMKISPVKNFSRNLHLSLIIYLNAVLKVAVFYLLLWQKSPFSKLLEMGGFLSFGKNFESGVGGETPKFD